MPAAATYTAWDDKLTRQLTAILERRLAAVDDYPPGVGDWVFPSPTSATGHVQDIHHLYSRIGKAGSAKFWFHCLRNCFITVAERELMLPSSLTKRLVNHARPNDVTEGYAADWTLRQLAPWVSHASPAASALTRALEIIGTALKSKEATVLPGSSLASLRWRSIRLRPRSASSCSTRAARKRAAVQPSASARLAKFCQS